MSTQKRVLLTALVILPIAITIGLMIGAAVTEVFVLQAIAHIIIKAALAAICLYLIHKSFKDQLKKHKKPALIICAAALFIDMVVLSSIRYIISEGVQTILFFPACIPVCFTALLYYIFTDSDHQKSSKKWAFIIGIPLVFVALVFEVISFMG